MFIVAVPLILILFVVVGIGAGLSKALSINIMPIAAILCLIFCIVSVVKLFQGKENESMTTLIVMAVISFIFFIICCSINVNTGDILSWLWYTF